MSEHSDKLNPEWALLRRQWLVACTSRELSTQPIARTVLDVPLVLFRSGGRAVALLDRCPHRHAPLSAGRVVGECVQCPYHGWQFESDGHCAFRPGAIENAPPESTTTEISVPSYSVTEQDGLVWICLEPGGAAQPLSRHWNREASFGCFHWVDLVESAFGDALENLLDGTHTPFVHSGIVRSPSSSQSFSAIVRVSADVAEVEYINEGRQAGLISRLFERSRSRSFGRFVPPCLAELEYTSPRGTEFVLNSFFTPESSDRLRVYSTIFLRRSLIPLPLKRLVITPLFRRVLKQDQWILKLQQDNIRRFGGCRYHSWSGDVLRGWIETWLRTGALPGNVEEHHVEFYL